MEQEGYQFYSDSETPAPASNQGEGQAQESEGTQAHHMAIATSGSEGMPAVATSSNSDGPSHNSSQGAEQSYTPASTPPSTTAPEQKHKFRSLFSSKNHSRASDKVHDAVPRRGGKERKGHGG